MADPIIMPKLGQMTEESKVVRWLKREGETVAKGDMLLEIETDKAVMEIESFYDGTLLKILVQEGETVPVMATLAFVGKPGEKVAETARPADTDRHEPAPTASVRESPRPSLPVPERVLKTSDRIRISPRAAGLAAARGVDVRRIQGSGPGGRIIERDVISALSSPPTAVAREGEPLSKIRRVIARRLTESYTKTPHFFATVKVDMSEIDRVRAALKDRSQHVSVTDFIIKAAALALVDFPLCNARTDGQVIVPGGGVHIGLAVALEEGLVVPVIRGADARTLLEISRMTRDLTEKARAGKLTPDEMTGGTFTVSNLGMLGVESFTAIINPGESAILAVSSTSLQPVVAGHEITARPIMKMTLSSDHRLIDGALAARFLNAIRSRLENKKLWWAQVGGADNGP
ncbi:MAG: 2-oxo acid dehydrogenase subunit E2 [Acidobacteria bacterium]|nr:MAG: 2-oxo acid dehydrogenase subunit E2 [Acidobacteriota bacterium]